MWGFSLGRSYRKMGSMEMFGVRSGSLTDNKGVWGGFGAGFGVLPSSPIEGWWVGSHSEFPLYRMNYSSIG